MSVVNKKQLADGVFFTGIQDSRFKTMRITANMIVPLSEETASAYALLCGVLSYSCKDYPDFTVLSRKLSSLYGADLSSTVKKSGDFQILSISAGGIDDRYAFDGESITEELSTLLCKAIFEPNAEGGAFASAGVEQERRQLLDTLDAEFNDKRSYANNQLIRNMCADEIGGISRYGTAEKIKEQTPQSLFEAWQKLLKTARFEIMYVGDSTPDKAEMVFTKAFEGLERIPSDSKSEVVREANEVKRVTEELEVSQSKLVMGFRTAVALGDADTEATRLMIAVLGGTANSKLFCNVREKQSLCYYCAARYMKHKGIMIIDSGVEGDNIEKAEQGILKEIEDMKNGIISDFEINATKLAVINSMQSTKDTVSGIEAWYTSQLFEDGFKSIEEAAERVNAVTKEQLVAAANKLSLDTIFVLKNK